MSKINLNTITIPEDICNGWQAIVNLLADIVNVPSALVMRIHQDYIEVFSSNNNNKHPYAIGDCERLGQGLYCEYVINNQTALIVPDATEDPEWKNNPDMKFGMRAYMGVPINWPSGEPFGTICVLDNKKNEFSLTYKQLLCSFRDSIEAQLTTIIQNEELRLLNDELKSKVDTRTQDLVYLNYSLNQEIDKRRAVEKKLHHQKFHDSGTQFLNQLGLQKQLRQYSSELDGNDYISVIHIGFANGASIQSKYGFHTWEKTLVQYRKRLGDLARFSAFTARPSATDLVLCLRTGHIEEDLNTLCNQLVDIGHSEFLVNHERLHLHTYIGISSTQNPAEVTHLYKQASEAMQSCKDSGHKFSFYSQATADLQKHISQLESYLLQAVRNDDLLLYFQPKVSPASHRWTGAEALLRWRHPILGDVSNQTLIHLAEQNGLIFEVGNFVLRSAIKKASEWMQHVEKFRIAVNVSAIQLQNPQFVDQVHDLLHAYNLPPQFLELEITESSLIADEVVAHQTLDGLNKLGIMLSLDDFGTGYASFNYLKKFPFHAIKIDKSFIHQIDQCDEDKEIVRSIIHVAKKLNLSITVEGIESEQHEAFIIEEGCEYGQGYYYGKPMPCDEFEHSFFNQNYTSEANFSSLPK